MWSPRVQTNRPRSGGQFAGSPCPSVGMHALRALWEREYCHHAVREKAKLGGIIVCLGDNPLMAVLE